VPYFQVKLEKMMSIAIDEYSYNLINCVYEAFVYIERECMLQHGTKTLTQSTNKKDKLVDGNKSFKY